MRARTPGRHALTFVLITVFIDMIGIGLIIPVLPDMIRELTDTDLSDASTLGGWLAFAYAAMQFGFGPLIGSLSDAYGRRPVLLVAVLGLGIDYLLTAFSPTIAWLFAGRIIAGLCGASYTTANAFIADVTAPHERARAFGLIGAAFGIGFVVGPAIGGLLGEYGHRVPFFVAAGLALLNVAYGWFVLPESLPAERRRPFRLARANPLGTLLALRHLPLVMALGGCIFVFFLAQSIYPSLWTFYTMYRYGWSESAVGLSLAAFGIIFAAVQATLVGPIIKRLGERKAALLSLGVALIGFVGYATASEGWMVFIWLVLASPQGVAMPAVNALMSREVAPDAQGELQGGIASLQGISSIAGPLLMTQLFGIFTGPGAPVEWPGLPFLFAGALTALSIAILWRTRVASA